MEIPSLLSLLKKRLSRSRTFENKRFFERVPAELSMRFLDVMNNRWALVRTLDLSEKGIGLLSNKELLPYTTLEMWLPIPNKGVQLYSQGEVIWSEKVGRKGYRAGIRLDIGDLNEIIHSFKKNPSEYSSN